MPIASPEVLVVAGEASGDHYGAELVHKIAELNPSVRFFGMGGDRMGSCGVDLVHHIKEVSVMGFIEVISRLGPLYRSFRQLIEAARQRRPQAAIFIDFPDYNLRLAPRVREACGARNIYYIGPTVWAWRPERVRTIQAAIDRMIVIFPFEEPIYRAAGVDVRYVGHPLVGAVRSRMSGDELRARIGAAPGSRILGLLPGSRNQSLLGHLPVMRDAARILLRDTGPAEVVVGLADSLERKDAERIWGSDGPRVRIVEGLTHEVMKHAEVLITACGTAPLEAAILGTPQVVVYRTSPITFALASRMVHVDHACIVNLILERRALPELIQQAFTAERVAAEAARLIQDRGAREAQESACRELRTKLGAAGASKRAARAVLETAGIAVDPDAVADPGEARLGCGAA